MAIQGLGAAGVGGISGAASGPKPGGHGFGRTLQGQLKDGPTAAPRPETAPLRASPPDVARPQAKVAAGGTAAKVSAAGPQRALEPARLVDQVAAAQQRMDAVLELAQSGKSFTPAELISLQSQMYRASQELDLAGKVVEKATGGVKQILQTQV